MGSYVVSSAKRQSLSFAYNLNFYTIMSKQNENAHKEQPTRIVDTCEKDGCFDAALHELQCLEAGLNLDKASDQTRFFLGLLKERLMQKTNIRYHEVINQLCSYFDDADFTYTKLLELMNDAQTEIGKVRNKALTTAESEDRPYDFDLEHVHEFFYKMGLLLWNLKPIAIDVERSLQDKGSNFVGYSVGERAAK
jgi:hypothetical protein